MCLCVFQEATEGRGVDVIVEMLANVNLSKDFQMLAYGGRVAVSNNPGLLAHHQESSKTPQHFNLHKCLLLKGDPHSC